MIDMDGPCICPGDPDHAQHPNPCGAPNSGTGHGPWCGPCNTARLARISAGFHVGFTGPRSGMTPYQRDRLRARLAELQAEHGEVVFHYGQAVGADDEAGAIAHALGWRVVSHPSDRAAATATVVPGAEVREPKPPLVRNRDIVHESNVLLATPRTVEEELRSGTWATIRYARKVGVPVELIHPLPYHGSRRAGSTPDTGSTTP